MNAYVIDSNVPIVANGNSPQALPDCVLACTDALDRARNGIICLDDECRIVQEYMNNLSMSGQPGAGDAFMKWIFLNQANPGRCETVRITPTNHEHEHEDYSEFPDDPDLRKFDPSDRKFVAVAVASQHTPSILNAVDSDWRHARGALDRNGIQVEFLCANQFADWPRNKRGE